MVKRKAAPIRDTFQVTGNALVKSPKGVTKKAPSVLRITPDPAVWAKAIELAKGDGLRCVVRSSDCVDVYNNRMQARRHPNWDNS